MDGLYRRYASVRSTMGFALHNTQKRECPSAAAKGYNRQIGCLSERLPVQILKYPHPILRHKCKPLRRVDGELRRMIAEMFDLMYNNRGIGLAANQVGLPYRLIVVNPSGDSAKKEEEHVFINPELSRPKGSAEDKEGCLSLPDIYAPVRRPAKITVSAYNAQGQEVNWELSGLFARVVQHECDHLDATLLIDRLSPTSLMTIKQDLTGLELEFAGHREQGGVPEMSQIAADLAALESART